MELLQPEAVEYLHPVEARKQPHPESQAFSLVVEAVALLPLEPLERAEEQLGQAVLAVPLGLAEEQPEPLEQAEPRALEEPQRLEQVEAEEPATLTEQV